MPPKQIPLFDRPTFHTVIRDISIAMAKAVDGSGMSREQAVDLINKLARQHGVRLLKGNGKELTLETFEKWLNPNEEQRYPSYRALLVFCAALGTIEPIAAMAKIVGGQVLHGQDVKLLTWAREYRRAKDARKKMRRLEDEMR